MNQGHTHHKSDISPDRARQAVRGDGASWNTGGISLYGSTEFKFENINYDRVFPM